MKFFPLCRHTPSFIYFDTREFGAFEKTAFGTMSQRSSTTVAIVEYY